MRSRTIVFTICTVAAIMLTACKPNGGQSAFEETSDTLISGCESKNESIQTADAGSDIAFSSYSVDSDNEDLIDGTISKIKAAGFSLDITQYYDFEKAEWKQGAEAELQQMQINSPSQFSRIVSKVYAILNDYEQSARHD